MKDMKLYHGSKTGIDGMIMPSSRQKCDFGSGFYMGTDPMQAKAIVSERRNPVFYELNLKLSQIPEEQILVLDGKEWMYHVLYNRGRLEELSGTKFYADIAQAEEGKDIVLGPIADDRMNPVIWAFTKGHVTDTVVMESMKCVNYGLQYVAKTQYTCSCIEVIKAEHLTDKDREECNKYRREQRYISDTVLPKIQIQFRNQGLYYDQVIEQVNNSELTLTDEDLKGLGNTNNQAL